MMTLLWQTAALLLAAYFLGAFLGCLIRRTFFGKTPVTDTEPAYAGMPSSVAPGAMAEPEPVSTAPAYRATTQPAYPAESAEPLAAAPQVDETTAAEPEVGGVVHYPRAVTPKNDEASAPVSEAPSHPRAEAEPVSPPPQESSAPYRPVIPPVGDRKRSIGTSAAAAAALAAATARYRAAQEAARAAGTIPAAAGSFDGAAAAVTAPPASTPATDNPDDLTRIRGIDPELSQKLSTLGVRKFSDIAAWRKEDIQRISAALGFRGRIEQENWIEQAQILATGTETAYSRRRANMAPLAKPSADEGERRAPPQAQPASAEVAPAPPAAATEPPAKKPPPTGLGRHHLQRIKGITPDIERLLNLHGVHRYDHIARWTAADVKKFDQLLGRKGRIAQENWIEQAQILANRGLTAFARQFDEQHTAAPPRLRPAHLLDAIREAQAANNAGQAKPAEEGEGGPAKPKFDLSTLRSVRSEAFQSDKAEVHPPQSPSPGVPKQVDDLKRIRGIGVALEKRLNGLGYWTYEQIANWTAADVDRISRALDIPGRIEQENWIEQAQILATGGQTWFARRRDRGEVAIDPSSNE